MAVASSKYTQANQPMAVRTPLGPDDLLLIGIVGEEAISQPFHFELQLLATNDTEISFEKLLGKPVTVEVELPGSKKPRELARYFHGICHRFAEGARDEKFTEYRMNVVPEFWLLTKKVRSRIFQQKSVPDILKIVLAGLNVDYRGIQGTFQPRDYCVQYRESDFAFASRLMEEEGIFYFFRHDKGSHQMVLANTPGAHPPMPANDDIIHDLVHGGNREEDVIASWTKTQEIRSGKVTLWDHTFELPHKHLEAVKTSVEGIKVGPVVHRLDAGGNNKLEIYDHPGRYAQRFDGISPGGGERPTELQKIFADNERTAQIRMQQEALPSLLLRGTGYCRQFVTGHKFSRQVRGPGDVPPDGGTYVLTSVGHAATVKGYRSGERGGFHYYNNFTAIPIALPYRPLVKTSRPIVQGTQTAVVVGPPGEEIFTDKYGRVKVQFHWDREGKNDADSSCWVRVGTPWAGKQWGMIHLPRIDQEVIVAFEEGDPDRPIVVGSVYNAEMMPPWKLPENRAISGIKSATTPGSSGHNELSFDDTKGKEMLKLNAPKDMSTTVKNDQTTVVKEGNVAFTVNRGNATTKFDLGKAETEAMQAIEFKVGQSSIKLDQKGVTIKGLTLDLEGQLQTKLKGMMVQLMADAIMQINGGMTMIG